MIDPIANLEQVKVETRKFSEKLKLKLKVKAVINSIINLGYIEDTVLNSTKWW